MKTSCAIAAPPRTHPSRPRLLNIAQPDLSMKPKVPDRAGPTRPPEEKHGRVVRYHPSMSESRRHARSPKPPRDASRRYHDRVARQYDSIYDEDPYWAFHDELTWRA